MSGRSSKAKGSGGEREVLKILQDHGIEAHRNDQRYVGGKDNPDISASLDGIPFHVEVKRKERFSIYEAMTQAVTDANGKAVPVVAYRRNRGQWLLIAQLDDILKLKENVP